MSTSFFPMPFEVMYKFVCAINDMQLLPNDTYRVKVVHNNFVYTCCINESSGVCNLRCYKRGDKILSMNYEKLPAE